MDIGTHQIIIGGESGPGARPFNIQWARSAVEQCRDAEVACFVKQLGKRPVFHWTEDAMPIGLTLGPPDEGQIYPIRLKDKKGGSMPEWPEDLRVRQFPEVARG